MPVPGSLTLAAWRERRDKGRRRARVCVALWRKASATVSLKLRPAIRCSSEDALDSLHDDEEFVFQPGYSFHSSSLYTSYPSPMHSATYHLDRNIFNTALKRTKTKPHKPAVATNRNNYVDYRNLHWVGGGGVQLTPELGYNERCIDECIAKTKAAEAKNDSKEKTIEKDRDQSSVTKANVTKDTMGDSSSSGVESMTHESDGSAISWTTNKSKSPKEHSYPPKIHNTHHQLRNRTNKTSWDRRASWQKVSNKAVASQLIQPSSTIYSIYQTSIKKPVPRFGKSSPVFSSRKFYTEPSRNAVPIPLKVEPIYARPIKKKPSKTISPTPENCIIKKPEIEDQKSFHREIELDCDSPPPPLPRDPPPISPCQSPVTEWPPLPPPPPPPPRSPSPSSSSPPPPPLPSNPPPPIQSVTKDCFFLPSDSSSLNEIDPYAKTTSSHPLDDNKDGCVFDVTPSAPAVSACAAKETSNYVEVHDTSALCRLVIRAGLSTHDTSHGSVDYAQYTSKSIHSNTKAIENATSNGAWHIVSRTANFEDLSGPGTSPNDRLSLNYSSSESDQVGQIQKKVPYRYDNNGDSEATSLESSSSSASWRWCSVSMATTSVPRTPPPPPPPPRPTNPELPIPPTALYKERIKNRNRQLQANNRFQRNGNLRSYLRQPAIKTSGKILL
ncbi:uncharacterized protein [Palaemon carinicauda]|uniref:uncharacterized protein n=1 Tax=Palaemon carinicauda TaxID=392227 RepID=UPI0035B6782C